MGDFITKLQNSSEGKKKVIFFSVMGVLVAIALVFLVVMTKNHVVSVGSALSSFNLPNINLQQESGLAEIQQALDVARNQPAQGDQLAPNETDLWKTHKSSYGFAIKYPETWFIDESIPEHIFISKESSEDHMAFQSSALQIIITDVGNRAGIADVVDKKFKDQQIDYLADETTIGNNAGLEVTTLCEGVGCGAPEWFVINNGYLYDFYSGVGYENTFDAIISTVHFTEAE